MQPRIEHVPRQGVEQLSAQHRDEMTQFVATVFAELEGGDATKAGAVTCEGSGDV